MPWGFIIFIFLYYNVVILLLRNDSNILFYLFCCWNGRLQFDCIDVQHYTNYQLPVYTYFESKVNLFIIIIVLYINTYFKRIPAQTYDTRTCTYTYNDTHPYTHTHTYTHIHNIHTPIHTNDRMQAPARAQGCTHSLVLRYPH